MALPPGFTLENTQTSGLPPGFTLEQPGFTLGPPRPQSDLRDLGLGTRNVIQGVTGLPGMAYDAAALPFNAGIAAYNKVPELWGGGNNVPYIRPAAQQIQQGLTSAGLPIAETPSEQRRAVVQQGAAGVVGGFGVAQALRQGLSPLSQKIAELLSTRPAAQVVAGASGAAGSQVAREALPPDTNPYVRMAAETGAGVVGAVSPQALTATGRRIATPVRTTLTPEEMRLVQVAKEAKIPLTAGQQTGSVPLQTVERVLGRLPFSSGQQQRLHQAQREAFNKAVLGKAGVVADNAAPNILQDAFTTHGKRFDTLSANTTVKMDTQFWKNIDSTAVNYARRLPTDIRPVFQSYVDDINAFRRGKSAAVVSGKDYQTIASDLRTASRAARNTNPQLSMALDGLVETMDDAMGRSMGPTMAGEWKVARREYRNLLQVDEAMSKGTAVDRTKGNVPLGSFDQTVKSYDKRGYGRGSGEYNDLARVGSFLANKIPDSGTAANIQYQNWLTGGVAGGGTAAAIMNPATVIPMATALAVPPTFSALMNSPWGKSYLTNQRYIGPNPAAVDPKALAIMLMQQQNNQNQGE